VDHRVNMTAIVITKAFTSLSSLHYRGILTFCSNILWLRCFRYVNICVSTRVKYL